jgi:hypothetical protein
VFGELCPGCNRSELEALRRQPETIGILNSPDAWVQTFTGKKFDLLAPSVDSVCIEDIAHALALQCRFNGNTKTFYSVAEHSVHVSFCVSEMFGEKSPTILRTALLHDASEAYIGDMVKPLKDTDEHFREVEKIMEEVIARRFGLIWPHPEIIKRADNALLVTERNALHGPPPRPWKVNVEPYDCDLEPWDWEQAERLFLHQAHEYLVS